MKNINRFIVWVAVLLLIIFCFLNILLLTKITERSKSLENSYNTVSASTKKLNSSIEDINDRVKYIEDTVNKINTEKPKDGRNGKDGANGVDGIDSKSHNTIETKVIEKQVIKEVPVKGDNGLTPIIKCNVEKNRWEYKFLVDKNWQLLNNEVVRCTP